MPLLLCILLLGGARWAQAHNGAVALAVPLAGIEIDGDLADWPEDLVRYPLEHIGESTPSGEGSAGDFAAAFRLGYEGDLLYVAVEVEDDVVLPGFDSEGGVFTQDSCELFLEAGHRPGNVSPYQYFLRGPVFAALGRGAIEPGEARVEARWGTGGYTFEWAVDISKASQGQVELQPGVILGFDLQIMDRDAGDTRKFVSWSQGEKQYLNSDQLGDALIVGAAPDLETALQAIAASNLQSLRATEGRIEALTAAVTLLITLPLALGLGHFCLFAFYPTKRENFYFALFAFSLALLLYVLDSLNPALWWSRALSGLGFFAFIGSGLLLLYLSGARLCPHQP